MLIFELIFRQVSVCVSLVDRYWFRQNWFARLFLWIRSTNAGAFSRLKKMTEIYCIEAHTVLLFRSEETWFAFLYQNCKNLWSDCEWRRFDPQRVSMNALKCVIYSEAPERKLRSANSPTVYKQGSSPLIFLLKNSNNSQSDESSQWRCKWISAGQFWCSSLLYGSARFVVVSILSTSFSYWAFACL